jgi:hypothetical protein
MVYEGGLDGLSSFGQRVRTKDEIWRLGAALRRAARRHGSNCNGQDCVHGCALQFRLTTSNVQVTPP